MVRTTHHQTLSDADKVVVLEHSVDALNEDVDALTGKVQSLEHQLE